jgi:hypothetical protein
LSSREQIQSSRVVVVERAGLLSSCPNYKKREAKNCRGQAKNPLASLLPLAYVMAL